MSWWFSSPFTKPNIIINSEKRSFFFYRWAQITLKLKCTLIHGQWRYILLSIYEVLFTGMTKQANKRCRVYSYARIKSHSKNAIKSAVGVIYLTWLECENFFFLVLRMRKLEDNRRVRNDPNTLNISNRKAIKILAQTVHFSSVFV